MTRARITAARRGFTLVELLVSMAVIIALASLALMVVPAAIEQDRTTDGATLLRQWLMISKSRAARDNLPRGVRLIVDPAKGANQFLVTELQYTEAPPVIIPRSDFPIGHPQSPKVVFTYTNNNSPNPNQAGVTTNRQCQLLNLDGATIQELLTASAATPAVLVLPVLAAGPPPLQPTVLRIMAYNPGNGVVVLDPAVGYPDAALGAAGVNTNAPTAVYTTYHFGIYTYPRPLLGEPTLQMPRDIVVDLNANVSQPAGALGADYDVVFGPSGQILPFGPGGTAGRIQLWVRNSRKGPGITMTAVGPPLTYVPAGFDQGGEQQLVSIKTKSGALGAFKVRWPDNMGTGQYNPGFTPYSYTYRGADEAQ
jgi:prepilin-type N-terminal cleavage/methylation domain-containing protein